MKTYLKIEGYGRKSLRGNRFERYHINRYAMFDGELKFREPVAWSYKTLEDAELELARIKNEEELIGYAVEVLA